MNIFFRFIVAVGLIANSSFILAGPASTEKELCSLFTGKWQYSEKLSKSGPKEVSAPLPKEHQVRMQLIGFIDPQTQKCNFVTVALDEKQTDGAEYLKMDGVKYTSPTQTGNMKTIYNTKWVENETLLPGGKFVSNGKQIRISSDLDPEGKYRGFKNTILTRESKDSLISELYIGNYTQDENTSPPIYSKHRLKRIE